MENADKVRNGGETVYLSGGLKDKAFVITKHNTEYLPQHSKQEESDTQMILHVAITSRNGANKIIVNSSTVLLSVTCTYLEELWNSYSGSSCTCRVLI